MNYKSHSFREIDLLIYRKISNIQLSNNVMSESQPFDKEHNLPTYVVYKTVMEIESMSNGVESMSNGDESSFLVEELKDMTRTVGTWPHIIETFSENNVGKANRMNIPRVKKGCLKLQKTHNRHIATSFRRLPKILREMRKNERSDIRFFEGYFKKQSEIAQSEILKDSSLIAETLISSQDLINLYTKDHLTIESFELDCVTKAFGKEKELALCLLWKIYEDSELRELISSLSKERTCACKVTERLKKKFPSLRDLLVVKMPRDTFRTAIIMSRSTQLNSTMPSVMLSGITNFRGLVNPDNSKKILFHSLVYYYN